MSFGKKNIGKRGPHTSGLTTVHGFAQPASVNPARMSRTLVLIVAGIVGIAALLSLLGGGMLSNKQENIQVDAALIDGLQASAMAQSRTIDMCTDATTLAASGATASDAERQTASRSCSCAINGAAGQLSPLQMQMVFTDYRTRLRASLARIDRTGESIPVGGLPIAEVREGAAVVTIAAAHYEGLWRQARDLMSQQAARCQ